MQRAKLASLPRIRTSPTMLGAAETDGVGTASGEESREHHHIPSPTAPDSDSDSASSSSDDDDDNEDDDEGDVANQSVSSDAQSGEGAAAGTAEPESKKHLLGQIYVEANHPYNFEHYDGTDYPSVE